MLLQIRLEEYSQLEIFAKLVVTALKALNSLFLASLASLIL
jgi:hypothetical protein